MSERKFNQVGTRPIRHDGHDKVTGRAAYGDDIDWPGTIHAEVLRSPHAHASIVSIDTSVARELDGVHAVIHGADFPDIPSRPTGAGEGPTDYRDLSHNVMARDKVLYHGHAVAAVAARTREIARAALALIDVEYEPLEPVLDLDSAMAPGATILHEGLRTRGPKPKPEGATNIAARILFERGDLEQGFAEADCIIEREFTTPMVHQGYIEPHAVTARSQGDDHAVIYCSTQGPFAVRTQTAFVLGIDVSKLKVIPSEIGGGFGGKTTIYLEPLAVLLSRISGRPVKMVMSREEVFRATGPTSGSRIRVKLGARRDGTVIAGDVRVEMEAGAFKGSPAMPGCMCVLTPYRIPNFRIEGFDVVVNKPKVAAYRAPGAPMAAFAVESVIDELARELEVDEIDLRLHNAVRENDVAPYGPRFQRIGFIETLEAARSHPHYRIPLAQNQGRGVASGFWFNAGMQSSANVTLNEDGTAIVATGNPDIGGSRASLAMMVAEELGIESEQVTPLVGDTESVGFSDLTGGSRVTYATGMAAIEAAREIVDELRRRAAVIWDVELVAVEWREGCAVMCSEKGADPESLSIADLAAQMGRTGGPIVARASLNAPTAGPAFGTHICDVEVDPETGVVKVLRYTVVQDVGKAVHPSYVEGQMQGGAAQGIGWALNEEYVFDSKGVMQNPGFLDYRMPVASDLPMIDTVIVEVPNSLHPYGVRGVGETPIIPPLAAVANAVRAATGTRICDLPMSPPRVLEAIDAGRG